MERPTGKDVRRRRYLPLIGAFLLGVFGAFFLFAFAYLVATDPGDNLTLAESGIATRPSGERFVTGTIRNNTGTTYPHVLVGIHLLDEAGRVVEDTVAVTSDFAGGTTWHFEVPIQEERAVRATLDAACGRSYQIHREVGPASVAGQKERGARPGRWIRDRRIKAWKLALRASLPGGLFLGGEGGA